MGEVSKGREARGEDEVRDLPPCGPRAAHEATMGSTDATAIASIASAIARGMVFGE